MKASHSRIILGSLLTLGALPAFAFSPAGQDLSCQIVDEAFEGYFVEANGEAKGSVLIVHDWDGLDDYERQRADMLAGQGYDAFAVDLYGTGNRPQALEDKQAETNRLYEDRERMRDLIQGGMEAALAEGMDSGSVILGYCFGGTVALEMARANSLENVTGYASFHGGLDTPEGQSYDADIAPIFIAHGGGDQIVSLETCQHYLPHLKKQTSAMKWVSTQALPTPSASLAATATKNRLTNDPGQLSLPGWNYIRINRLLVQK